MSSDESTGMTERRVEVPAVSDEELFRFSLTKTDIEDLLGALEAARLCFFTDEPDEKAAQGRYDRLAARLRDALEGR